MHHTRYSNQVSVGEISPVRALTEISRVTTPSTAVKAPASPQTARYERKRESILEAAALLFNAHGLAHTTLADVARSVGLTITSITYYYRKKEDLAVACLMRAMSIVDSLIDQAEAAAGPAERLTRLLNVHCAWRADIAQGRAAVDVNFWDMRALTGPAADTAKSAFVALFRRLRALFCDPDGPKFSRAEQNARAHLVFTVLIHSKGWITRLETSDYPRAAARTADILLHGLAGPGQAWAPRALAFAKRRSDGSEVSRASFLRAATELVNEFGYHGASVDRISARLNVTKGSFYHHNENKGDLVAACFDRTFAVIRSAHAAGLAQNGDGWSRLCAITASLLRHQLSEDGPLLRLSALSATADDLRPELLATFTRLSEKTAALISDGIADGSIRPVDTMIASELVTGMINSAAELSRWSPATTMDTAAERFAKPLLTGVFSPGERG